MSCYAYSRKCDTKRMILSTAVNKRFSPLEKKVNRRRGANLRKFVAFPYKPWLAVMQIRDDQSIEGLRLSSRYFFQPTGNNPEKTAKIFV